MSLTSTFRAFAFIQFPYCQYCLKELCYAEGDCAHSPHNNATCDHYTALARGGKDRWSNFILSCQLCNHDKDSQDWSHKTIHGPTNWGELWSSFLNKHIKKTYKRKEDYRKVVRSLSKQLKKFVQEKQKSQIMSSTLSKKELFLGIVQDTVTNLLYYDRKDDEQLSCNDISTLIDNGEVSLKELIDAFKKKIIQNYPDIKSN